MRRSLKNRPKICVPILEPTRHSAFRAMGEARLKADLIELRLDYMGKPELKPLLEAGGKKPIIVTNRRSEEGGRFHGREEVRLGSLRQAIDLEAAYVDLELGSGRAPIRGFMADLKNTALILSHHNFKETPPAQVLRSLFRAMERFGPEVVKIVTMARSFEDNLKTLALIPFAGERGQDIVAFCMGEKGKMSRIFAPLLGAAWTYAALRPGRPSAPGQLAVSEMRQIWKSMK